MHATDAMLASRGEMSIVHILHKLHAHARELTDNGQIETLLVECLKREVTAGVLERNLLYREQ